MKYNPALEGTFRAVQVPGPEAESAYIELERKARSLYVAWVSSDYQDAKIFAQYQLAQGQCVGFRQAVTIYCPDTPGYSNTSGHLIMAADMALDTPEVKP